MANTIIEQVKSRKFFYRNLYRKELVLLIIFIAMAIMWIGLIMSVSIKHSRTVPDFYASSSDGILTPLQALSQPNRSSKAILE